MAKVRARAMARISAWVAVIRAWAMAKVRAWSNG